MGVQTEGTVVTTNKQPGAGSDERAVATVMDGIRSIVRALRLNTRAIEGQLGISLAQLWVLQILNDGAAQSLNDLAAATVTHQSSVSVVVGRLVDAGLATRTIDPADRRLRRIAITEAGRALLIKAPPTFQVNLMTGLWRISAEHREQLAALMQEWLAASGVDLSTAPPMMMEEDGASPPTSRVA
jgi:DNA-binding MarR family transcriptional regulator